MALQERNRDTVRILRELDLLGTGGDTCVSFDYVFMCGDLNYRSDRDRVALRCVGAGGVRLSLALALVCRLGGTDLPDRATAREDGAK